jgi:FkbM family methyltransferase
MASEPKKVKFDPFNMVTRMDPAADVTYVLVLLPCTDGAIAQVTLEIEAPTKLVAEDLTTYDLKVTTSQEVVQQDRTLGEGGRAQRSDGLSWWIPTKFPGASIALLDHEPKIRAFIMGHFKEDKIFVDIGANFGGYSVRAAAWDMKVYAFEPNPENVKIMEKNIEINHVAVNLFPFAIGATVGMARMSPNGGFSRINPDGSIEVEMRTLDSFDLPGADLLKIDVEGYELEVLKGAKKTLEKFHPFIVIEMHYWAGARSEAELFQILSELGYKFEYIDRFGLGMHLAATPT